MLSYYLLRNNQESGPFTLADLRKNNILTSDLIWIEGESTCWKNPTEIAALKGSVSAPKKSNSTSTLSKQIRDSKIAALSQQNTLTDNTLSASTSADDTQDLNPSFEKLKEKYAQKGPRKRIWRHSLNIGANVLGIATLLIGLGVSVFMIKKAVENIEWEPIMATAETKDIQGQRLSETMVPHAAFALAEPASISEEHLPVTQTEISSGVSTSETSVEAPGNSTATRQPAASKKKIEVKTNQRDTIGQNPILPEVTNEGAIPIKADANSLQEKTTENTETNATKPTVRVGFSDFKVGLLGGISDLEITVTNPSVVSLRKAVVEVEYLKPNGKVVGSQNVEIATLKPGESKKISVPDFGRGVRVQYKIIKVE